MRLVRVAAFALLGSACGGLVTTAQPQALVADDGGVAPTLDAGPAPAGEAGGGGRSVVLYSGPVYSLARDGRELFFTVILNETVPFGLAVKRCSVDDCSAPTLIGIGGHGLPALAVDKDNVYWTANQSAEVLKCPRTGCDAGVKVAVATVPLGIASDGTDIFYADDVAVWKCATTGCGVPTKVVDTPWTTNGIALDADNVYFTSTRGAVGTCPKTGCASPTIIAPGPFEAAGIAVDATHIYWASRSGVYRCAIAGCGGSPERLTQFETLALAVDETDVYYTMLHSIMRCAKSGCVEPTVFAADQLAPVDIVLDATSVYWTDRNDPGAIRKAPKI